MIVAPSYKFDGYFLPHLAMAALNGTRTDHANRDVKSLVPCMHLSVRS